MNPSRSWWSIVTQCRLPAHLCRLCRAQCTRFLEEASDAFKGVKPRSGYNAAAPAGTGRPIVPAAAEAARIVTRLLTWAYLMPSYESNLTGACPRHPDQASCNSG